MKKIVSIAVLALLGLTKTQDLLAEPSTEV